MIGIYIFSAKVVFKLLCVCLVGKETVHELFGTRVAVLAGDFMFAQASWYLANLENLEVIKLISQVKFLFFFSLMSLEEATQYREHFGLSLGLSFSGDQRFCKR